MFTIFIVIKISFSPTVKVCGLREPSKKIVGGRPASNHPWIAGIVDRSTGASLPYCGGVLINDRYVMTAAHCLTQFTPQDVMILLGARGNLSSLFQGEFYAVEKFIPDPRYSSIDRHQLYDFGLIKLDRQVKFDANITPVCLPGRNFKGDKFDSLLVAGWGRVSENGPRSPVLLETEIIEMPLSECQKLLGTKKITEGHICAGDDKRDACSGDSGGPLLTTDKSTGRVYTVGVTSWGVECAHSKYPGVFSKVWSYAEFINSSTFDARYCNNKV